jgi:hypothetical protein
MKLPIILGAMIAALAIPNSIASEATEEKTETAAPEAAAETKSAGKKKRSRHHKRAHHHKGAHHHRGHHSTNSPQGPYRGSYDDMKLQAADGYPNEDRSPAAGTHVAPVHKTP